ncbi:unnamed protein product, partial [Discosporangium mesarthrocarpum]
FSHPSRNWWKSCMASAPATTRCVPCGVSSRAGAGFSSPRSSLYDVVQADNDLRNGFMKYVVVEKDREA